GDRRGGEAAGEEEERRGKAEEEARRKAEEEEAKKKALEESKQRSVEEAQRRKEEESRREVAERAGKAAAAKVAALAAAGKVAVPEEEEEPAAARRGARPEAKRPAAPARRDEARRRAGKMTGNPALTGDEERMRSLASVRRARERERLRLHHGDQEQVKVVREVVIPETITVQELANRMAERAADVIKGLMRMGVMATINQVIDADTAELVVTEF